MRVGWRGGEASGVSGEGKGEANLPSTPARARGPATRRGLWCAHSLSQQRCHASPRSRSTVTCSSSVVRVRGGKRASG